MTGTGKRGWVLSGSGNYERFVVKTDADNAYITREGTETYEFFHAMFFYEEADAVAYVLSHKNRGLFVRKVLASVDEFNYTKGEQNQ